MIINLCGGLYYNLIIYWLKVFKSSPFYYKNYLKNSEEWKLKEKLFFISKPNINFLKKLLTEI